MSYRIFLSHTERDTELAKAIVRGINNAFEGSVEIFLAKNDIAVGSRWKEDILRNLRECDGLICLLTKASVGKPWLLIEWAAFWLQEPEKDIFILLGDGVNSQELVAPMVDRQLGVITNPDHLRNLFRTLSERAKVKKIPFSAVPLCLSDIEEAIRIQTETEYNKYKQDLSGLPSDDTEKSKIALHFLAQGELTFFEKIIELITSDYVRVTIALNLIAKSQLSEAQLVAKHTLSARNTGEIVNALISRGYEDIRVFEALLDQIGYRDESEFTQICLELAKVGKEDTELFATVAGRMNNMAELRKVAMQLIDLGKHEKAIFSSISNRFADKNRRELEKVGEYLVQSRRQCESQLIVILDILHAHNKEQFMMLTSKVEEVYPQFLEKYLDDKL
jgi:hypothetical protein